MIDDKLVYETLQDLMPERAEEFHGWLFQPAYDKGKAEGKAEGVAEGKAKLLSRLLEKRFGAIPRSIRQRILTADGTSIETWFDRVLDAPDLQSVFASN